MPIISLENLLKTSPDSALEKVVRTARHMEELTSVLRAGLEPEMAQQLVAASLSQNQLVLIASSSAWASKLRFEGERLIVIARNTGATVDGYRVTVSKYSPPGDTPPT